MPYTCSICECRSSNRMQPPSLWLQVSNRTPRFPAVEHCIRCLLHLPGYMQGSSPLWGWSVCSEYSCESDHVLRWCWQQKSSCRNHQGEYICTKAKDQKVPALRVLKHTFSDKSIWGYQCWMLPRCGLHCECHFLCYMLSSVPEWGTTTRSDQRVASHLEKIVAHGKIGNFPWPCGLCKWKDSCVKLGKISCQIGGWEIQAPSLVLPAECRQVHGFLISQGWQELAGCSPLLFLGWNPVINSPVEGKVVSPIIYGVLAPSQVVAWDFFHQQ